MTVAIAPLRIRAGVLFATAALTVTLSACESKRASSIPLNLELPPQTLQANAPLVGDQKIGPMDVIDVRVFQVAELSGEHLVDPNGFITMPLIGRVQAQGKSAEEFGQFLADRLGQKYLRSPNVNVAVKTAAARTITVDGAVGVPGVFPIQGRTTLIRAIAIAKGTADNADTERVYVIREIAGKRMAARYDLQKIRRVESPDPEIFGNDIIIVDGSKRQSMLSTALTALPFIGLLNTFIPF